MVSKDELMTIAEAMEQHGHSRQWWYDQIAAGRLTVYDILGERNTFLLRTEVAALFEPKARPRPDTAEGAQG
jgi:hypothetical protein